MKFRCGGFAAAMKMYTKAKHAPFTHSGEAPHPLYPPLLKFGFLRGRAEESPTPASGRVKIIKIKRFSLRRLRRRSEKRSSF
jgi:hypothetical protein